jgi:hypothetical protein
VKFGLFFGEKDGIGKIGNAKKENLRFQLELKLKMLFNE